MNVEKLQKMAGTVRTGGKGTVRRKKKAVHKASGTDEKRLQSTLKRLGVSSIPGIEEVLLLQEDGTAIAFANPKVQASVNSNTYVVSGASTIKSREAVLADQLSGLGGPAALQQLLASLGQGKINPAYDPEGAAIEPEDAAEDDDEDVPALVGDFESALKADEEKTDA